MINKQTKPLDQTKLDLIDRYITAHNEIEQYLRIFLHREPSISFSQLVREFGDRFPRWQDRDQLLVFADLRNALVHNHFDKKQYLSVPTDGVVEMIEQIRDRLISPDLVIPLFQVEVIGVQIDERLSDILAIIDKKSISQFPVYRGDEFLDLLTENGITRWLATHVHQKLSLVDFEDILVEVVLSKEESREKVDFINRATTTREAEDKFVKMPALEALLITQNGKKNEKPLGIITHSDLITLQ